MKAPSPSDVDTLTGQTDLLHTKAAEAAHNLTVEGASDPQSTETR